MQQTESNIVRDSKPILIIGFNEVRDRNETLKEQFEKQLQSKLGSRSGPAETTEEDGRLIKEYVTSLKSDLQAESGKSDLTKLWLTARKWVRARQIIPEKAPELGSILQALQTAKIIKSDVSRKGTQLKLLLTLEGGQFAFFKPMRYPRDYTADDIYSGADRHNGEIVGMWRIAVVSSWRLICLICGPR